MNLDWSNPVESKLFCLVEEDTGDTGDDTSGKDDTTAEEGDSSAKEKDQTVPYARFKEVNDALKAYKGLGLEPEEIVGLIKSLQKDDERASGDTDDELSDKEKEVLKVLEKLLPRTSYGKKVSTVETSQQSSQQAQLNSTAVAASEFLESLIEEAGIPAKAKSVIEDHIAARIMQNPKLYEQFRAGHFKQLVRDEFRAVLSEMSDVFVKKEKTVKNTEKKPQSLLPSNKGQSFRTTTKQLSSDNAKGPSRSSTKHKLREAGEEAWDALMQMTTE